MEDKIIVQELVTREDGTIGIGNSIEVDMGEARRMVMAKTGKLEGFAIGVFPENKKVEKEE